MQHTYSHPIVLIICSGIAVYMAIKEMERYYDNHDTSSVAMKRFSIENDQDSQFPTFSICFHQGNVIYSSKAFTQHFNKSTEDVRPKIQNYKNILEGWTTYNPELIKRLGKLSLLTIRLKDLIHEYRIENEDSIRENSWRHNDINDTNFPFVVTYQTARTICFTLEEKLPNNINKKGDIVNFKKFNLKNLEWKGGNNKSGSIYLYVHAQGQLIRNLDRPIFSLHRDQDHFDATHTVAVKRVDVLKRRQDANIPCKSYHTNEDLEYLKTVVKDVRCVPIFWESLNITHTDFPFCNSTEQYKKLLNQYNGYMPTPRHWVKLRWLPCYEMAVSSVHNMKVTDHFRITIRYQDLGSQYFETTNTRDFGFENLWSSLGGIVGVFLGYSIINIFEMINDFGGWVYNKCEKSNAPSM